MYIWALFLQEKQSLKNKNISSFMHINLAIIMQIYVAQKLGGFLALIYLTNYEK